VQKAAGTVIYLETNRILSIQTVSVTYPNDFNLIMKSRVVIETICFSTEKSGYLRRRKCL